MDGCLFDPVPVGNIPKFRIPSVQDHPAKRFGMCRHPAAVYERHDGIAVFGQHIVQLDRNFATFCQITCLGQFVQHRVIGRITEPVDIFTLPLAFRLWLIAAAIGREIGLGVCAVKRVRVHFHIRIEFLECIGAAGVTAKEDRCVQIAKLGFNTDFTPPLFDQGLKVLANGVG